MSRYDVKDECDMESQRDVTLTSYNKSPVDDVGILKNVNITSLTTNSNNTDGRLMNLDILQDKTNVMQVNIVG
jgi:hypothetical protein